MHFEPTPSLWNNQMTFVEEKMFILLQMTKSILFSECMNTKIETTK